MTAKLIHAANMVAVTKTETVVPDPGRLIFALRQIGYSLEQALSDLIDNSISADARNVLIRFIWADDRLLSVAVVDDGAGMEDSELQNAMRFGSKERIDQASLGKFGLGLKLASFSHAQQLTVVSVRDGSVAGRRWTLRGIRRNWDCEIFDESYASQLVTSPWTPIDLSKHGTLVLWDEVDKLPVCSRGLRFTLRALHRRLELYLGLHFHRYLQSGRLRIHVDQQEQGQAEHQIRVEIPPLDPFAYPEPPIDDYPSRFSIAISGVGELAAEAHIWPPNSELPEYKLGNRAAARQGFYFYRNDRLIQAGGWNGLVQNEAEPHSSLTRVRIELPAELDSSFSLNVQKSSVIPPTGFVEAVQEAESANGVTFDEYRITAQRVYRKTDKRAILSKVVSPGTGLSPSLADKFKPKAGVQSDDGVEDHRQIRITWEPLDKDEFFRIDVEGDRLLLNSMYRTEALAGLDPQLDDLPLVKTLLFLLLETDLKKARPSDIRRRELARINRLLVSAAKLKMG